jgi:hypothetical protein
MNSNRAEEFIDLLLHVHDCPEKQILRLQSLNHDDLRQVGLCLLKRQERIMMCFNTALRSVWAVTSSRAAGEKPADEEIPIDDDDIPF